MREKIILDNNKIINLYKNGLTQLKIAKIFNVSYFLIYKILKENKIQTRNSANYRKHKIDETYFQKINTDQKAYFLGWLYSDGNTRTKGKICRIAISVYYKDANILEDFKKDLRTTAPLLKVKKSNQIDFRIYHKKMTYDLVNLGCIPQKSLKLQFPSSNIIPNCFMPHFIRGFFEGNGSITITKDNCAQIGITSSTKFCLNLEKFLLNNNIINKIGKRNTLKSKYSELTYTTIRIGGLQNILNFYKYIYNYSQTYLLRKKQIFEKFFQMRNIIYK